MPNRKYSVPGLVEITTDDTPFLISTQCLHGSDGFAYPFGVTK